VGDGCFGKNPRKVDRKRYYLANAQSVRHVWSLFVGQETIDFIANDEHGQIVDQVRYTEIGSKRFLSH
jgi:hypothetical protein